MFICPKPQSLQSFAGCLLFLALFLLGGGLPPDARAQEGAPANLITNPGFEEGIAPWGLDNWAKNDASAELDKQNPHSGQWSMRVRMNRLLGEPILMFAIPHLRVRADEAVEVRFWARGVSNGTPVNVIIRHEGTPYTKYFTTEISLTDEWQEYSFRKVLPSDLPADDISLRFCLNAPGVFWIDDISMVELPPVEPGRISLINPIRNPSFEAGTDGWTATIREREFGTPREESGSNTPSPVGARLQVKSDGTAPNGRRFLTCDIPQGSRAVVTSAYFPARYGHPMRLAFSIRSDGAHPFEAGLASDKNGRTSFSMSSRKTSAQWQSFSLPMTLKPAPGGLYTFRLKFEEPGRYDIDAVSIVEEEAENPDLSPPSVAIEPAGNGPVAHLYTAGEKAAFRLVVAQEKPGTKISCQVAVFDYRERKSAETSVSLTTDTAGYGDQTFEVPTKQYGAFRIEARRAGSPELLAEQLYSVLPTLPPPAQRPDSYFGGHVDLTPYGLEIARKAGFRWLRLYPPLSTLWMTVEPAPGKWDFRTDHVKAAHAEGFKILGLLATTPDFAADRDPAKRTPARWATSYPPADLGAWKEYVTRCTGAFGSSIDAWEVWNEHDGGYMQVRPGVKKEDVYERLLQSAREAVNATGKPTILLGPGVAQVNASLGWEALARGANCLDAFSFHFYSLAAGGGSPNDDFVLPLIHKYFEYKNRSGERMPLWITEGGTYLNGSQSWLATYRIPPSSSVTPPQAAASVVRGALLFKALGVHRYFDYQAAASASGRMVHEDITCPFIDVTGIPGPGIAAHAAMVALTEDASPAGFESKEINGVKVKTAHFRSRTGPIDAYWSTAPLPLAAVVHLQPGDEVRDMMGNPLTPTETKLGEFPIYLLKAAR